MSMVGNQTNSQDPQAVGSRIFVGNLNTFQCTKGDVERIFQRYGRIAGISMHRGYAFVQFTNQFDAKSACQGEDGRTVLGQTLDVNLVTEPKPHQIGKKRTNTAKTANDWDYFYDSYYASSFLLGLPTTPSRVPTVMKRPRIVSPVANLRVAKQPRCSSPATDVSVICASEPVNVRQVVNQLKSYSNPDFLICGNCRELFSEIGSLLEHKRTYCKMRFTCKCAPAEASNGSECNGNDRSPTLESLVCSYCQMEYKQSWEFLQHVQNDHNIKLYEIKLQGHENNDSTEMVPADGSEESKTGNENGENNEMSSNGNEYEVQNGHLSDNECNHSAVFEEEKSPPTINCVSVDDEA